MSFDSGPPDNAIDYGHDGWATSLRPAMSWLLERIIEGFAAYGAAIWPGWPSDVPPCSETLVDAENCLRDRDQNGNA